MRNLNSSLSNFGKLVRLRVPECYLSCRWQETLRLVLVKMGTASVPNRTVLLSVVDCEPWSSSSLVGISGWAMEENKQFVFLYFLQPLSWADGSCKRKVLDSLVVKHLVWLNPGCVFTWKTNKKKTTLEHFIFFRLFPHCGSSIWCSRSQPLLNFLFCKAVTQPGDSRWSVYWDTEVQQKFTERTGLPAAVVSYWLPFCLKRVWSITL